MTYEEYINLGPEDRMRARLNDLALVAARQEPVKAPSTDLDHPEQISAFWEVSDWSSEFQSVAAKVDALRLHDAELRAAMKQINTVKQLLRGREDTSDFTPSEWPGKWRQLGQDRLERISQKTGVNIAEVQRVIEACEHFDIDEKQ